MSLEITQPSNATKTLLASKNLLQWCKSVLNSGAEGLRSSHPPPPDFLTKKTHLLVH